MYKSILHIFVSLSTLMFANAQTERVMTRDGRAVILYNNHTWQYEDSIIAKQAFIGTLPVSNTGQCAVVHHTGFSLCYNETHEQAEWVAYMLCRSRLVRAAERTDRFVPDPKVKTGSADHADYRGSGFDRGHLAPAADMAYSEITMRESFYFSNISPQVPAFNRGIWKRLEEQVRNWAEQHDTIWIATGPVLTENLTAIGPNKVSVPRLYYKAILVHNNNQSQAIAIVMPNQNSNTPLESFVITVDSLQKLTSINFFSELDDALEQQVEQQVNLRFWFGTNQINPSNSQVVPKLNQSDTPSSDIKPSVSTQQCNGIAKSTGQRCKNRTGNPNGYCHAHQSQAK